MNKILTPIEKAKLKPGMRNAINAKCYDCIYDKSSPGSWLKQVTLCPLKDCPIYPFRPKSSAIEDDEIEAVTRQ